MQNFTKVNEALIKTVNEAIIADDSDFTVGLAQQHRLVLKDIFNYINDDLTWYKFLRPTTRRKAGILCSFFLSDAIQHLMYLPEFSDRFEETGEPAKIELLNCLLYVNNYGNDRDTLKAVLLIAADIADKFNTCKF